MRLFGFVYGNNLEDVFLFLRLYLFKFGFVWSFRKVKIKKVVRRRFKKNILFLCYYEGFVSCCLGYVGLVV